MSSNSPMYIINSDLKIIIAAADEQINSPFFPDSHEEIAYWTKKKHSIALTNV